MKLELESEYTFINDYGEPIEVWRFMRHGLNFELKRNMHDYLVTVIYKTSHNESIIRSSSNDRLPLSMLAGILVGEIFLILHPEIVEANKKRIAEEAKGK